MFQKPYRSHLYKQGFKPPSSTITSNTHYENRYPTPNTISNINNIKNESDQKYTSEVNYEHYQLTEQNDKKKQSKPTLSLGYLGKQETKWTYQSWKHRQIKTRLSNNMPKQNIFKIHLNSFTSQIDGQVEKQRVGSKTVSLKKPLTFEKSTQKNSQSLSINSSDVPPQNSMAISLRNKVCFPLKCNQKISIQLDLKFSQIKQDFTKGKDLKLYYNTNSNLKQIQSKDPVFKEFLVDMDKKQAHEKELLRNTGWEFNTKPDSEFYFAESYKGRRPYNEDRFFYIFKNSNFGPNKKFIGRAQIKMVHDDSFPKILSDPNKKHDSILKHQFFAVFDGHGGSKCSQFLKQSFYSLLISNKLIFTNPEKALVQTFLKAQEKFLSNSEKTVNLETSGSCAVVCLTQNKKIYVANVGDSRAVLLGPNQFEQVTKDHKPEDKNEKLRILRFGGKLYKDGSVMGMAGKQNIKIFSQTRIMPGSLNVSRTIGDIEVKYKKYGGSPGIIIPDPDLFVRQYCDRYSHMILASDGLFQGLSNEDIHLIFKKKWMETELEGKNEQKFRKQFVKEIIKRSGQKSSDNITVILAKLVSDQN